MGAIRTVSAYRFVSTLDSGRLGQLVARMRAESKCFSREYIRIAMAELSRRGLAETQRSSSEATDQMKKDQP